MPEGNDDSTPADGLLPFSTTLHVRDTCMCLHLQRAARAVARKFDDALRPAGLTNGQFSLLMSLNRPRPPLMGDVAALLAMDRTTLTAMLKPLRRRGLVEIAPDESDKRGRRLILTQEGRALLARAMPLWSRTEAEVEAGLDGASPDRLRDDLRTLA
jgi:DNA-binding MarR family transcriptional regulator